MTSRPARTLRAHAAALVLATSSLLFTGCATVATVEMAAADALIPPSQEAQLGARQIALGIQSANAAWDALQAALSVAPNQPAPKPESRATAVAEAAGTTAPALKLATA